VFTYFIKIICVLFLLSTSTFAQLSIDGSFGIDLNAIGSSSESLENSYDKINASRYITNHYLSLGKKGSIISENFASYSLFTSFKGYFNATNADNLNESFYKSPDINNLNGNLTFFPTRTYPLQFYYLKSRDVSLFYDKTDRTKTTILTPGLAVLEKNRSKNEKYGTSFLTNLFSGASFNTNYSKTTREESYDYDFGENRNTFITTLEQPDNIFSPTVKVIIKNNIGNDSVRIISESIDVIIPPNFNITLNFDPGFYFMDIIPLNLYNQNSLNINLEQGILYRIDIDIAKFPAKSTVSRQNTYTDFVFDYLKESLSLKTSYVFEENTQELLDQEDNYHLIRNQLLYNISRKFDISIQSEKNNREDIRRGSKQTTDLLRNSTILNFSQRRGINGNFAHDFNKTDITNSDGSEDNTTDNLFTSILTMKSVKLKHNISLKNIFGKQNKTGLLPSNTTQNGMDLNNDIEFRIKNIKFKPRSSIKLRSTNVVDTVENKTDDLDIVTSISGLKDNVRFFGDVFSKLSYSYIKRDDNLKSDINKRWTWEAFIVRNISDKHRISFTTSHSWKSFGGEETIEIDSLTHQRTPIIKPSEYSSLLGFKYSGTPWEDVDISSGLSFIKSPGNRQVNMLVLIKAYVPFIKIPFSTEISKQSRDVEDLPRQTLYTHETSVKYTYNKIRLELSHIYSKEKLVLDKFSFYELALNIVRSFSI
jgi:hypothetical protein